MFSYVQSQNGRRPRSRRVLHLQNGLNRSTLASLSQSLVQKKVLHRKTVRKEERRIFGVEIYILMRFIIRSVYTVYGRYYENLPNFDVILERYHRKPRLILRYVLDNYLYVYLNED